MRKISSPLLSRVALVCAAVVLLFTITGQAQPQSLLTRHVRDEVANGQAQFVGQLPATQTLLFDIVLPLRDRAGLQNFVQEVQNPTSPSYHQFLTPQEVTARFGPSQEDWDALVAFAKASGFDIISGNREKRDLALTGTVANIEKAFHVTMGTYRDLTEDRTFFAVDREPTVDLPFQLWHITGLDNDSRPHPMYVKKSDYAKAHGIDSEKVVSHATTGSGPSASFLGSDMRAAYYERNGAHRHRPEHRLVRIPGHRFGRSEHVLQQCWANRTLHSHPHFHGRVQHELAPRAADAMTPSRPST